MNTNYCVLYEKDSPKKREHVSFGEQKKNPKFTTIIPLKATAVMHMLWSHQLDFLSNVEFTRNS